MLFRLYVKEKCVYMPIFISVNFQMVLSKVQKQNLKPFCIHCIVTTSN